MPIQLNHKNGAEVYHRPLEKRSKFSIFGSNNQMNYGYVAISDEERNNRGFYTEIEHKDPAYYRKGLKLENAKPIGAPVWTLPLPTTSTIDQPQEAQPSVTESITPSVTGINKMGSKTVIYKNTCIPKTYTEFLLVCLALWRKTSIIDWRFR
jgi:hypothetical protein